MAESLTGDARRFLRVLFDRAHGRMDDFLDESEIGAAVPLSNERTAAVVQYLLQRGYLDGVLGPGVCLTPAGIDFLETEPVSPASGSRVFGNVTFTGPATVTFGDHSPINITKITIGDFLRGVEAEIEARVADPEERKSLLARMRDLLNSPAAGEIIRVGLPEILKRLLGSGGSA